MNHSIYSADRAMHLKILVVALVGSIAVAALAIGARINHPAVATQAVKVGQPVVMSSAAFVTAR